MMMKRKAFLFALITSLAFMGLAACDGGSSKDSNDTDSQGTQLSLSAETLTIKVGENVQITPNIPGSYVYSSNRTDVATVSNVGLVHGVSVGEATITATGGGKKAEITFKIVEAGEFSFLGIDEYCEALGKDPYAIPSLSGKEKYGLSKGEEVGVKISDIAESYPVPKDSEFSSDCLIDIEKIGLSEIQRFFPLAKESNFYYAFQTALNLAASQASENKLKIKLPSGDVAVDTSLCEGNSAFVAEGLKNVYIEGNNTNIILKSDNLVWKSLTTFSSCSNVHLNDVTLDYSIPPTLTGSIKSIDLANKKVVLEVAEEFSPLLTALHSHPIALRSYVEYDNNTLAPLQGGNFVVDGFPSYSVDGNELVITFKNAINHSKLKALASVQFAQYDAVGMRVSACSDFYVENVTFHHVPGMAFVSNNTTNLYMNRFNLMIKSGSASLNTATADGIHLVEMHGDVKITNCLLENSHDDALNIKQGYWYKLSDAEGGTVRSMKITRLTSQNEEPKVGDKIGVYDENDFSSYNPSQGYYTISEIQPITNGYKVKVKERMSNVSSWGTSRVTFISNTPKFTFANNIVRNKRNRGILVQVPTATIKNNAFINVGHGSIQAGSAMDVYNEATLPQEVSIFNNKFINNCYLTPEPLYGDVSCFAIASNGTVAPSSTLKGISVHDNYFAKNGNAALSMRGVGSSSAQHNLFYDCSRTQPSGDGLNCLFQMVNNTDFLIASNYNHYTLEKGLSGVIMGGTDSESDVLLDNNHNIGYQTFDMEGPSVRVEKMLSSVTIDGNLSDWEAVGASDVKFVGYSQASGEETNASAIANHFAINSFKMTHDDSGIYMGFDIKDNYLDVKTVNDFWLGDCVEVMASTVGNMPNADLMVYKDYENAGVIQAAFAPTWASSNYCTLAPARTRSEYLNKVGEIKTAFTRNSEGYVGEVKLPFSAFPLFKKAIDLGTPIEMSIVVADAERKELGLTRVQAGNVPHFVENYKTKTLMMPKYTFAK